MPGADELTDQEVGTLLKSPSFYALPIDKQRTALRHYPELRAAKDELVDSVISNARQRTSGTFRGGASGSWEPADRGFVTGVPVGFAKGVGSTAYGATEATNKLIRLIPGAQKYVPPFPPKPEALKPKGTAEKVGYGAEQIGEFMLPGGELSKAGKAVEAGVQGWKYAWPVAQLAKGALEAGSAGLISTLQGKSQKEIATNAILGGTVPITSGLAATALKGTGRKILQTFLRPTAGDLADGFEAENLFKYGVAGNVAQVLAKTGEKIKSLLSETKQAVGNAVGSVDLLQSLAEAENEMTVSAPRTFGQNKYIQKAFGFFEKEIERLSPSGIVSVPDGQAAKVSLGRMGAWAYGRRDPKADAIEAVANNLYSKVRADLEKKAPALAGINKQLSELIPIERTALRRLPVDMRNNIASLSDVVLTGLSTVHPASWWTILANRALKSGWGATGFYATGRALEKAGPFGGRIAAGIASTQEKGPIVELNKAFSKEAQ